MIPTNRRKSGAPNAVAPILVLAAIIIAVFLLTGFQRLADRMAPQTGDIIAFPATRTPSISTASITVSPVGASGRRACVLDVPVMQKSGGSLVVEATQFKPDRSFQVHWTGVRTSNSQEDCGGSVDLLLNSAQIAALVFAAGGTGVKAQN